MTKADDEKVQFKHGGENYIARLDRDAGTWRIVRRLGLDDDGEPLEAHVVDVVGGTLDQAQTDLATKAEQQRGYAKPHLELADEADLNAAIVKHLADRLGPDAGKVKGRKVRG
jgi:hypothetical protein